MSKEGDLSPEQIAAAKDIISAELTMLPYDALLALFQQSSDFIIDGEDPLTEVDFINQIMIFGEQQVGEVDDETKLMMGVLSMEAMFDNLESFGDNPVQLLANFIIENKVGLSELKIEDKQDFITEKLAEGWKFGVITHWLIHVRILRTALDAQSLSTILSESGFELEIFYLRENSEMLLLLK